MAKKPASRKAQIAYPRRGEIYFVDFDPTIGHEIKKVRPVLILQNNIGNQYSCLTVVAAISSQTDNLKPIDVFISAREGHLPKDSVILLNQIRTIDKRRLKKCVGAVNPQIMGLVNMAIKISLGIDELV